MSEIKQGRLFVNEMNIDISQLDWNDHPSYEGVALKNIVTGDMIDKKISCHLVRVKAGCEIEEHVHASNCELHEPISGTGKGIINNREIDYFPGISVVVPEGVSHRVTAGEEDLYFLAKFVPALV